MAKLLLTLLFSLFLIQCFSQDSRKIISGKIVADSPSVEGIHVINKSIERVTLTNKNGEFEIPARINDTLVFSAVQFEPYHRIIVPQDFHRLQIIIRLKIQINELNEVKLKRNNLAIELGLPNAEKIPKTKLEARLDGHSKASSSIVALDALLIGPLLNKKGGINNLYYLFSGERKKDRKLQNLLHEDQIRELNNNIVKKIRQYFKEDFFIHTLKIPSKEIDAFITHCMQKGMANFYLKNQKIQLIELMLTESIVFLGTINNEEK